MKRRGFTLAEILIALAIIGVIAAITLPMANKLKPDTTKVLYLTTYDALRAAVSDLADNDKIYPQTQNEFNFKKYPFANTYEAKNYNGHDISAGRNKLCRALAESFNILEDIDEIAKDTNNACNNTYQAYNNKNDFKRSFTSKNGVEFMISTQADSTPQEGSNSSYTTYVTIDINGMDKGPNEKYSNTFRNPDRFSFKISADGEVRAIDEAGIFYLETRTSLYKKGIEVNNDIQDILNENDDDFDKFTLIKLSKVNDDSESDNEPGSET